MRRILTVLTFVIIAMATRANHFSCGIRDSRYAYGTYHPTEKISINLEHSLYQEGMDYQRVSAGADYGIQLGYGMTFGVGLSGATTWNGGYQIAEGYVKFGYMFRRIEIEALICPRYDTGLDYMTTWQATASVRITGAVSVVAGYTTVPLYRMSEPCIRGGFRFSVKNLSVTPELSFNVGDEAPDRYMRVLISMNYNF